MSAEEADNRDELLQKKLKFAENTVRDIICKYKKNPKRTVQVKMMKHKNLYKLVLGNSTGIPGITDSYFPVIYRQGKPTQWDCVKKK